MKYIILTVALLAGCGTAPSATQIIDVPVYRPCLIEVPGRPAFEFDKLPLDAAAGDLAQPRRHAGLILSNTAAAQASNNGTSHLIGGAMPHVYTDVHNLEGKPTVGNGDCVALVQTFTDVGWTGSWRPWVRVIDAGYIRVGTVIATFDQHGRYPNKPTGNHAGFFLGMGPLDTKPGRPDYFIIMEQWKGLRVIKQRAIYGRGRLAHIPGGMSDSNVYDNFWVVQ